jgi:hypothetical protein
MRRRRGRPHETLLTIELIRASLCFGISRVRLRSGFERTNKALLPPQEVEKERNQGAALASSKGDKRRHSAKHFSDLAHEADHEAVCVRASIRPESALRPSIDHVIDDLPQQRRPTV